MKKILTLLIAWTLLVLPAAALADTEVTIGVTGAFYEDLWQPAIDQLEGEGIHITLQQFFDFSIPNNALNDGEIDLNAFQHHAYFNNDTTTNGYDLQIIADTFVVTMNLFSSRYETLDALNEAIEAGEKLQVVVPNDATNYGRALILLRDAGLLELSEYESTPNVENIVSQKVELVEVNASMTYQYLEDADACAINGNYAASYGVDPTTAIYEENVDLNDESFICVIAVRAEDAENEVYNRIAEVFCSEVTSQVVHEKFDGFFYLTWEQAEQEEQAE